MFDAIEAINDIIDDINDDAAEYAESCYEDIYEELCYRVECGELSVEEAELINEKAYDMYCEKSGYSDIKKNFRAIKNSTDAAMRKAKRLRKKDAEGAIAALEEAKSNLEELKAEVKNTPNDVLAEVGPVVVSILACCAIEGVFNAVDTIRGPKRIGKVPVKDMAKDAGKSLGINTVSAAAGVAAGTAVGKAMTGEISLTKSSIITNINRTIKRIDRAIKKISK